MQTRGDIARASARIPAAAAASPAGLASRDREASSPAAGPGARRRRSPARRRAPGRRATPTAANGQKQDRRRRASPETPTPSK